MRFDGRNAGSEMEMIVCPGWQGDGGFVGVIDEVTIYNRALSADEIKQNFRAEGLNLAAVSGEGKITDTWGHIKSK